MNYKKSKQELVFEILESQGYILDDDSAKIFGADKIYKVHEYIRIWTKRKSDRDFFSDKKIYAKQKGYRSHLVQISKEDNLWCKVGKEFFNEIKI